jgi:hypothetical protein
MFPGYFTASDREPNVREEAEQSRSYSDPNSRRLEYYSSYDQIIHGGQANHHAVTLYFVYVGLY